MGKIYRISVTRPHAAAPISEGSVPQKTRVIDSLWTFVVAATVLGPLALPLLWRNPKVKLKWKIVATIVISLVTWWIFRGTELALDRALEQF